MTSLSKIPSKVPTSIQGYVIAFLCGLVVASSSPYSLAQSVINESQIWGSRSNGLQMAISLVKLPDLTQRETEFYVAFRNVGDASILGIDGKPDPVVYEQDYMLNLGVMLGNGRVQLPQAIRLILTDAQGKKRELNFSDKGYPGVAGRVDDFIVPLRFGSVYVLRLELDQFWCPDTKEFQLNLPKGRYRIFAEYESMGIASATSPPIPALPYWKGTLRSNEMEFEVTTPPQPKFGGQ